MQEVAGREHQFGLAVALKAGPRHHVEGTIGAVADVGGVTPALDFEVVNVLGINLRGEVGGDVGVGDLHAVQQPTDLVASAHMQHVMRHVGAWNVVGDHGHAVGAVRARGLGDVETVDKRGWRCGVDVGGAVRLLNCDGLLHGADLHLEVKDGRSV